MDIMSNHEENLTSSDSFFQLMGFVKKKPPLPEGWIVRQSSSYPDRVYFFNVRTGASTWNVPEIGSTSDSGSSPVDARNQLHGPSAYPYSNTTKSTSSMSLWLEGATSVNNAQQDLNQSKNVNVRVKNPSRNLEAENLSDLNQRTLDLNKMGIAAHPKQDNRTRSLERSRIEGAGAKPDIDDNGHISTSPPWGVPMRKHHVTGTLTPESTPQSHPSQGCTTSDTHSLSSQGSKMASPPPMLKPLPTTQRKKRSRAESSSDTSTSPLKSKHQKARVDMKLSPGLCHKALPVNHNADEDGITTTGLQTKVPVVSEQNDLRLRLERSRRFKIRPEKLKNTKQSRPNPASKLPSRPLVVKSLKNIKQRDTDNPQSDSSSNSKLIKDKTSKKSTHDSSNYNETSDQVENKWGLKAITHVNMENESKDARDLIDKDPGNAFMQGANDECELSQMEIDLPTDEVSANENPGRKNLGVRIVLDTNILMHDLTFVRDLIDQYVEGLGQLHLVIPWVVMQELDGLKVGSIKGSAAWKAVQFLHKYFMAEHPRVHGEPPRKVSDEADFEITCNDDWILQCCLHHQRKVGSDLVVLVSNDKHLCSKAVVNRIKAFSAEKLLTGLRALGCTLQQRDPAPPVPSEPKQTPQSSTEIQPSQVPSPIEWPPSADSETDLCSELVYKVKDALRVSLSVVLETEMKKAYDDLWTEIVLIKPPWTFQDIVQCVEKHWIAVFGFFLTKEDNRNFLQIVDLISALQHSLCDVKRLITCSLCLCRRICQHSRYGKTMEQCIQQLRELKKRCSSTTSEENNLPLVSRTEDSRQKDPNWKGNTVDVPSIFDAIWSKVLQLSALIFEGLGISHDLETDTTTVIPSELECHACLNVLCPLLQQLVAALERVTEIPDSCIAEQSLPFEKLRETIFIFLKEFVSPESERHTNLTTSALQRFVLVFNNRQMLKNGIIQLNSALSRLLPCQSISL